MKGVLEWLNTNSSAVTAAATVVLTMTTVIYAWLTGVLAVENRRLRRAGTEPLVIAYLFPDARHINILHLVIANVGRGPAQNLAIEFEADADDFAAHKIEHQVGTKQSLASFLPQDERLYHFFGNALDMFTPNAPKDFFVKVFYEDIKGAAHEARFRTSVGDLEGFRRIGESPEYVAAEALKAIREEIKQWSSGFRRLKVEVITATEQERKNNPARNLYRKHHKSIGDDEAVE